MSASTAERVFSEDFLLYVLFSLVKGILTLIPDYAWNVDSVALTNFYEAIRMVFYVVPKDVVISIIGITIVLTNIKSFSTILSLLKYQIPTTRLSL